MHMPVITCTHLDTFVSSVSREVTWVLRVRPMQHYVSARPPTRPPARPARPTDCVSYELCSTVWLADGLIDSLTDRQTDRQTDSLSA
jgi:hypothetical protein